MAMIRDINILFEEILNNNKQVSHFIKNFNGEEVFKCLHLSQSWG